MPQTLTIATDTKLKSLEPTHIHHHAYLQNFKFWCSIVLKSDRIYGPLRITIDVLDKKSLKSERDLAHTGEN